MDDSTLFEICEMIIISLMQESVNIAAEWTNNSNMNIKKNRKQIVSMTIGYPYGNLGNEVPNIII